MAALDANGNVYRPSEKEFGSYATPEGSQLASPATPRAEAQNTITAKPADIVPVASVAPSKASALTPVPPVTDATERSADFYRDGRFRNDGVSYDINPRRSAGWEYDEKLASIRLYGSQPGKKQEADLLPAYTKFFLENVQEGHAEKTQIVETFGKFYVYSFGERPPIYTFSGKLMSTKNADWASDFAYLYEHHLRSTKAAEQRARVIITYGGKQIEGLITSLSTTKQADIEGAVPFQIQVIVFERKFLNFSNDFGFSTGDGKTLKRDENFQRLLDQVTGGRTGLGTSDTKTSQAIKTAKGVVQNALPAQSPLRGLPFGGGGGTANV